MRYRMRRATAVGIVVLLSGFFVGAGVAANAETPLALDEGRITDVSDVLTDADEARLEQRLGDLASAEGRPELFVVLVPRFEEPANALEWADETALRNNLAPDQYLLAIATEGRSLAISAEYGGDGVAGGPLPESRVHDIEDELGAGYLADDDWAGGIEYVADEFEKVPWPWWVWLLGVVGLALVVFLAVRLVLHLRRRAALAAELRTLEGQKKRAARTLVQADEAVRTSEQELGFVTAEFGEEATGEFAAVLAACRTRLQEAFLLLEKLQDADEDSPQQTRSWTEEIIRLCGQVDDDLEGRKRELASLRAVTDGAADTLARLRSERAAAAAFAGGAADRLTALAAAFPPSELIGVADNPDEIHDRLRAADVHLAELQKAVDARRPKAIARAVHEIERLLSEAKALRDAVGAHAEALAARAPGPAAAAASAPGAAAAETAVPSSVLDRAEAAVRAAELSVQARAGEVRSFPLSRLYFAQRQLAEATAGTGADAEMRAASALAAAEQVQSLLGAPIAAESRRFVRTSRPDESRAIMYDPPASDASAAPQQRRAYADDDDDGTAGKAVWGGVGGGVVGFIGSVNVAGDEPGVVVLFVIGGVVLGALSSAFGGNGGGSSSGWGGSSRSSWGGSSRSSGGRSSGRSRSSGGSRSSGRSGGRRF